jgi:hypothetical protein
MKVRDLKRQDLIDELVCRGLDEAKAEAAIERMLDMEEWQIKAHGKIATRLANMMRERGAGEDDTLTVAKVIGAQELKALITEEWTAAREHAPDLN